MKFSRTFIDSSNSEGIVYPRPLDQHQIYAGEGEIMAPAIRIAAGHRSTLIILRSEFLWRASREMFGVVQQWRSRFAEELVQYFLLDQSKANLQ